MAAFKEGIEESLTRKPTPDEIRLRDMLEKYDAGEVTVMRHATKGLRFIPTHGRNNVEMAKKRGYEAVSEAEQKQMIESARAALPSFPKAGSARRPAASDEAPKPTRSKKKTSVRELNKSED